mgnify:FL=1
MSWNDQGNNNGSRDPWGRNNNPPPDIDEPVSYTHLTLPTT